MAFQSVDVAAMVVLQLWTAVGTSGSKSQRGGLQDGEKQHGDETPRRVFFYQQGGGYSSSPARLHARMLFTAAAFRGGKAVLGEGELRWQC